MIFNLLYNFHQTLLLLKYVTEVNKFGIPGKLLPSGASLYTFSLKRKKWCKKWQWFFSTFYLKQLKFCFEAETILRTFSARLGTVDTCVQVDTPYLQKRESFSKKQEVLIGCLILTFMKKLLLSKTIQCPFDFT